MRTSWACSIAFSISAAYLGARIIICSEVYLLSAGALGSALASCPSFTICVAIARLRSVWGGAVT